MLSLREQEFVLAAVGLGVTELAADLLREVLPNVVTTLIVFVPLMMAHNMVTESALSFLSIGVQPPDASWGTIIRTARGCSTRAPGSRWRPASPSSRPCWCLNVFGDGVRDALDPRARLRVGRR